MENNKKIMKKIIEKIMMLKLQYFDHLMHTADSLEDLMLAKIDSRRRWGRWRRICLDGITDSMDMHLGTHWEMMRDREA